MILVISKNNKVKCKRGHPAGLNMKIRGTSKRFCVFILESKQVDAKGAKMCGDVE